ncbi:MAG: hypothetical protein HYY06_30535 [Deltaproteobacteria bacterium]|nr:hypothetical protein [Deltaproteobacteria bacterium]
MASGPATLGIIGFEGRRDYGAVGSVVNLAARLCSQAADGQTLIDDRTREAAGSLANVRETSGPTLKGFSRQIRVFEMRG